MLWIVGAQGMLGGALTQACAHLQRPLLTSDAEVDITDIRALETFARPHRIAAIINCAAFTNVRACETQEARAMRVNADAVGNLAKIAEAKDALLVHVSTDFVFDGAARAPYPEDAATAPINAYGRTKLAGEERLRASHCEWSIVRASWLYGERGPNFVFTVLRVLAEKGEISVVTDAHGTPCYTGDLADALLAVTTAPPGVYHFANTGVTSRHAFASEAARLAADRAMLPCEARVRPIVSADWHDGVTRPAYSALATDKIARVMGRRPRPWQDALAAFVDGLNGSAKPWEPRK